MGGPTLRGFRRVDKRNVGAMGFVSLDIGLSDSHPSKTSQGGARTFCVLIENNKDGAPGKHKDRYRTC